jgi:hypothetical protein
MEGEGMDRQASEKGRELAERKARVLRDGGLYRVGIVHAKAQIKHGMRPDTIFHSALDHAGWALRSRLDGILKPTGVNLATLMPYALGLLGFIRRRRLGKPALAAGVALAALGWLLQRRGRLA